MNIMPFSKKAFAGIPSKPIRVVGPLSIGSGFASISAAFNWRIIVSAIGEFVSPLTRTPMPLIEGVPSHCAVSAPKYLNPRLARTPRRSSAMPTASLAAGSSRKTNFAASKSGIARNIAACCSSLSRRGAIFFSVRAVALLMSSILSLAADSSALVCTNREVASFNRTRASASAFVDWSYTRASAKTFELRTRLLDSVNAALRCASPAILTNDAFVVCRFSISRSVMFCRWPLDKNIPPSAKSSPATPTITINSKSPCLILHQGIFWHFFDSPINPSTRINPNAKSPHSENESKVDAADLDNEKDIPVRWPLIAGAIGFALQGICLAVIFYRRRRAL